MAKVKDVLERIGDDPLIAVLKERGYFVAKDNDDSFEVIAELETRGFTVYDDTPGDEDKMVRDIEERGYAVWEADDVANLATGYDLYRNRRTDELRQWLRNLFWQGLGRIA